jgi:hypothetical protein
MEVPGLTSVGLNKLATVLPIDNQVTKTTISSPLEGQKTAMLQEWGRIGSNRRVRMSTQLVHRHPNCVTPDFRGIGMSLRIAASEPPTAAGGGASCVGTCRSVGIGANPGRLARHFEGPRC